LEHLHATGRARGIRSDLVAKIERILSVLDTATEPRALSLPGYSLHPLKGDRKAFWAVTVKANWRIVFRFADGDAYDVELTDYH
jgi:proteic killer suppression protein